MTAVQFVIPGDLGLPTGGYAYDRRVLALLPAYGVEIAHLALPGSYPAPTKADLDESLKRIATTQKDDILLIDGLAYGAMPADTDPPLPAPDHRAGASSAMPGGGHSA